ncbi:iron-sulfur protein [Virgisporangium aliadipatigenens]|uniref:Cytochrome bc1 complex Rieske iron-sulfur subunit n=1 Tax=Virgisporangium aliadipatigenens TaxID=741659 RepID=A0A8J3YV17_9ACTN|nr:Rieske (2Fe-2S) protein [Virgisporangium aliadipatigenens]GIJ51022.1 iron-sulfur protein [Virgisporangium aliadipatigenens]
MTTFDPCAGRRALLAVGAAAALGGCSVYGGTSTDEPPPDGVDAASPPPPSGGSPAGTPPASGAPPAGGPAPLARTADIPVNGGKIFKEQGVVVTQPTAGTFKAFSATCTHQGCTVTSIQGGTIVCGCHGSKFALADGAVKAGPATKPLPPKRLNVTGDAITLA